MGGHQYRAGVVSSMQLYAASPTCTAVCTVYTLLVGFQGFDVMKTCRVGVDFP